MSMRNSLKDRRFGGGRKGNRRCTTPNVLRSQARKKGITIDSSTLEIAEAKRAGISVHKLREQKRKAAEKAQAERIKVRDDY